MIGRTIAFCAFIFFTAASGFNPVYSAHRKQVLSQSDSAPPSPAGAAPPWLRYPNPADGYIQSPPYSNSFQHRSRNGFSSPPTDEVSSRKLRPKPSERPSDDSRPSQKEVSADASSSVHAQRSSVNVTNFSRKSLTQNTLLDNSLAPSADSHRPSTLHGKRYIFTPHRASHPSSPPTPNSFDQNPEKSQAAGEYTFLRSDPLPPLEVIHKTSQLEQEDIDRMSLLKDEIRTLNGGTYEAERPLKFCASPILDPDGSEHASRFFEHREQPNLSNHNGFGTISTLGRSPIPIALQLYGTEGCQGPKHVYGHFIPEGVYTPNDQR